MYTRNRYTKNPRTNVRSHLFVIYLCNIHNTICIFFYIHIRTYIYIYIYTRTQNVVLLYTYITCTVGRSACYGKHETRSHAFAPLFDYVWRLHLQNPSGETIQFRRYIRKSNLSIGTKIYIVRMLIHGY